MAKLRKDTDIVYEVQCIVDLCVPAQYSDNEETSELAKNVLALIDQCILTDHT